MNDAVDLSAINVLSLASGGGGLDLGVEAAIHRLGRNARHVAYVEIEAYACGVLAARMEEGRLAPAPICTDLRSFDGRLFAGIVDLVVGGYPCQPFSLAGNRLGDQDPRHLWPHVARVIRECRPGAVFFENVSGHLSLGAHDVIRELQGMGYRVACGLFTAEEVGAPHKRERLFILGLGYAPGVGEREPGDEGLRADGGCEPRGASGSLGNPDDLRREGWGLRGGERSNERIVGAASSTMADAIDDGFDREGLRLPLGRSLQAVRDADGASVRDQVPFPPRPDDLDGWRAYLEEFGSSLEPAICRGIDGVADRLDRLRLLGNGVVPKQAEFAFLSLYRDLTGSLE